MVVVWCFLVQSLLSLFFSPPPSHIPPPAHCVFCSASKSDSSLAEWTPSRGCAVCARRSRWRRGRASCSPRSRWATRPSCASAAARDAGPPPSTPRSAPSRPRSSSTTTPMAPAAALLLLPFPQPQRLVCPVQKPVLLVLVVLLQTQSRRTSATACSVLLFPMSRTPTHSLRGTAAVAVVVSPT